MYERRERRHRVRLVAEKSTWWICVEISRRACVFFVLRCSHISFTFVPCLSSCTRKPTAKMSAMILWIVTAIIGVATTINAAGLKCDNVRPIFEAQGFPLSDIPKEAISCELDSWYAYHAWREDRSYSYSALCEM